jgi:hypothetical protein
MWRPAIAILAAVMLLAGCGPTTEWTTSESESASPAPYHGEPRYGDNMIVLRGAVLHPVDLNWYGDADRLVCLAKQPGGPRKLAAKTLMSCARHQNYDGYGFTASIMGYCRRALDDLTGVKSPPLEQDYIISFGPEGETRQPSGRWRIPGESFRLWTEAIEKMPDDPKP